jgi:hypothetical protein
MWRWVSRDENRGKKDILRTPDNTAYRKQAILLRWFLNWKKDNMSAVVGLNRIGTKGYTSHLPILACSIVERRKRNKQKVKRHRKKNPKINAR